MAGGLSFCIRQNVKGNDSFGRSCPVDFRRVNRSRGEGSKQNNGLAPAKLFAGMVKRHSLSICHHVPLYSTFETPIESVLYIGRQQDSIIIELMVNFYHIKSINSRACPICERSLAAVGKDSVRLRKGIPGFCKDALCEHNIAQSLAHAFARRIFRISVGGISYGGHYVEHILGKGDFRPRIIVQYWNVQHGVGGTGAVDSVNFYHAITSLVQSHSGRIGRKLQNIGIVISRLIACNVGGVIFQFIRNIKGNFIRFQQLQSIVAHLIERAVFSSSVLRAG